MACGGPASGGAESSIRRGAGGNAPPKAASRAKDDAKTEAKAENADEAGGTELPWIEDDWTTASAAGSKANKAIFADMWAPWCHTCLSMQATVFKDPSLAPYVDRFIWLAADTDKEANAELMGKVDMNMWPTFFVLDGADGSVQASFAGGASIAQIRAFLDDAEATYLDQHGKRLDEGDPRSALREGAQALREKRYADADAAYAKALKMAPADWSRRPDVLVDQIRSLYKGENWAACFALATGNLGSVAKSKAASLTDFSYYARRCAEHGPPAAAKDLREQLRSALVALEADSDAALSIDDRSDLLSNLRALYLEDKDEPEAKTTAERQRDLLAKAFKKATDPRMAMTYNWPRAEVHDYLGEGESLIADLEASVAALPEEYDPPYRLSWVLHKLDRNADALPHAKRASELAYGPRKARVLTLLSDIQAATGDKAAAKESLKAAVKTLKGVAATQRKPGALEAAQERLDKMPV